MLKAGEIPGSGKGRKRRQNRCFPFAADGGGSCGRRGNLLRFRRRAGTFAEASFDLSEFATVRLSAASSKNCSFYRTSLVKVLIENCSFAGCRFEGGYWQNVFAEESKFTGCDFNETVFKDTVFRRCLLQYANLNGSVLRQVILDETRLTDSELSECKVQGLQLRAADLTGTNCFKTYIFGYGFDRYGNRGITLSKDFAELRGALITPYQAGWLSCWG